MSGFQRRGFQVAAAIPGCWGSEICGGLARLLFEEHDWNANNGLRLRIGDPQCTSHLMLTD